MKAVLIVGCGDIGRRVAALYRARGLAVAGVVRSESSAQALRAEGVDALMRDLDDPAAPADLPTAGVPVFYFAPPPPSGATDPRLGAFLAAVTDDRRPLRVIYISTSGVYGDCKGAWITEAQPVAPRTDRARRRLAAENALRAWSARTGVPVVILRVPGIYGPGRLPVERLRKGLPVLRADQSPYSNRIHADDLARICLAAAERGRPGAVYNVADGHPTTMSDYFNRVADLLGMPRPPAVDMDAARTELTAAMMSFIEESRRIDNRRMLKELGIELRYPDLESGLAAMREAD